MSPPPAARRERQRRRPPGRRPLPTHRGPPQAPSPAAHSALAPTSAPPRPPPAPCGRAAAPRSRAQGTARSAAPPDPVPPPPLSSPRVPAGARGEPRVGPTSFMPSGATATHGAMVPSGHAIPNRVAMRSTTSDEEATCILLGLAMLALGLLGTLLSWFGVQYLFGWLSVEGDYNWGRLLSGFVILFAGAYMSTSGVARWIIVGAGLISTAVGAIGISTPGWAAPHCRHRRRVHPPQGAGTPLNLVIALALFLAAHSSSNDARPEQEKSRRERFVVCHSQRATSGRQTKACKFAARAGDRAMGRPGSAADKMPRQRSN